LATKVAGVAASNKTLCVVERWCVLFADNKTRD